MAVWAQEVVESCHFLDKRKCVFFQGPSQGNILDQRMFPLRNNKGRASGAGTVSNVRREAFKKKGLERENKNMGEEDKLSKEVDWEVEKTRNTKARKLSPEEVAEMMKPKEPQVKKEEVKKKEKEQSLLTKGRTKERIVERALPKWMKMKMEAQRRRAKVVQRALPKWIMKVRSQKGKGQREWKGPREERP